MYREDNITPSTAEMPQAAHDIRTAKEQAEFDALLKADEAATFANLPVSYDELQEEVKRMALEISKKYET